MIKIYQPKKTDLENWYQVEILKTLKNKWEEDEIAYPDTDKAREKILTDKGKMKQASQRTQVLSFLNKAIVQNFLKKIFQMKDKEIMELVTIPVYDMQKKAPDLYDILKDYLDFCEFYLDLLLMRKGKASDKTEYIRRRLSSALTRTDSLGEWIRACMEALDIVQGDTNTKKVFIHKSQNDGRTIPPKDVLTMIGRLLYGLNIIIGQKIDYSYMDASTRRELAGGKNVTVCPYCNQSFVYSLQKITGNRKVTYEQYLGDLDHLLPKSVYRIFSLSIWNLVPCCKSCNQIFKKAGTLELLNPYEEGFEEDCMLDLAGQSWDVDSLTGFNGGHGQEKDINVFWKINDTLEQTDPARKRKIENNIATFHLNDLYKQHQRIIRNILRRKYIYRGDYLEEIQGILAEKGIEDAGFINQFLYGVSRKKEEYQHEIHGKMIDDILKW